MLVRWKEIYEYYHAMDQSPWGDEPSPRISSLSSLLKDGLVLDIGCGDGRNSIKLLQMGFTVCAIDVVEIALAKLRSKAKRMGLENALHTLLHDVHLGLPFRDSTFDLVVDSFTFTFIKEKERYVGEVRRVLRKGGIFLLEFNMQPHILSHEELMEMAFRYMQGFKVLRTYTFYHSWGCISNERAREVPAIALMAVRS
ncbi:MAG: class I SAM-dependent methyltransferase [Thermoprotei archaeon]|nr:class I SAM-dependent methyltransferase [Thermoprotei archaeon]